MARPALTKPVGKCRRRAQDAHSLGHLLPHFTGAAPDRDPRPLPQLTLGQRQGGLFAAGISQGEHGSVAVKERPGFVQQDLPQPPHVALFGWRSGVHGQVGPRHRRLSAVLLQPLQPLDRQLARLGHLRGQGRTGGRDGPPSPPSGALAILDGEKPAGACVMRERRGWTEGQVRLHMR